MEGWKQGQASGMINKLKVDFILHLASLLLTGFVLPLQENSIITGLKRKKEQFELEMEQLGSIREMQLKESETSGRISGLNKKVQYADIEEVA